MIEKVLKFLKILETRIPPPQGCHHAITYAQFGSDESGWSDKLALQVNVNGVFQCWFLDDDDLDYPNVAADGIRRDLSDSTFTPQLGVGFGQYLGPDLIEGTRTEGPCRSCGFTTQPTSMVMGRTATEEEPAAWKCPNCGTWTPYVDAGVNNVEI